MDCFASPSADASSTYRQDSVTTIDDTCAQSLLSRESDNGGSSNGSSNEGVYVGSKNGSSQQTPPASNRNVPSVQESRHPMQPCKQPSTTSLHDDSVTTFNNNMRPPIQAPSASSTIYAWENLDDGSMVSRPTPVSAKTPPNKMLIGRKLIDYDNLTLVYDQVKVQHADLDDPGCGADTWNGCFQWDDDFPENGDEFTIDSYTTELTKKRTTQETGCSKPPLTPKSTRKYSYDTPAIEEVDEDTFHASRPRHYSSDTPVIKEIDESTYASFDGTYDERDEYSLRDEGQSNWRH